MCSALRQDCLSARELNCRTQLSGRIVSVLALRQDCLSVRDFNSRDQLSGKIVSVLGNSTDVLSSHAGWSQC
uniref:Uncharacterized protein n=1 Tax=Timema shepardi TaxID=629360 RepID=A0A7R9B5N4_TIMSH|nr:unnamed protein product [Timema shepardi]